MIVKAGDKCSIIAPASQLRGNERGGAGVSAGVRHNNHYSFLFVHFHVNRIRIFPIR